MHLVGLQLDITRHGASARCRVLIQNVDVLLGFPNYPINCQERPSQSKLANVLSILEACLDGVGRCVVNLLRHDV